MPNTDVNTLPGLIIALLASLVIYLWRQNQRLMLEQELDEYESEHVDLSTPDWQISHTMFDVSPDHAWNLGDDVELECCVCNAKTPKRDAWWYASDGDRAFNACCLNCLLSALGA